MLKINLGQCGGHLSRRCKPRTKLSGPTNQMNNHNAQSTGLISRDAGILSETLITRSTESLTHQGSDYDYFDIRWSKSQQNHSIIPSPDLLNDSEPQLPSALYQYLSVLPSISISTPSISISTSISIHQYFSHQQAKTTNTLHSTSDPGKMFSTEVSRGEGNALQLNPSKNIHQAHSTSCRIS